MRRPLLAAILIGWTLLDREARAQTEPVPQPAPSVGAWEIKDEISPIDDTRTVALVLKADGGTRSALAIRCKAGRTEVFLAWFDYLGRDEETIAVTTRLDSDRAMTAQWSISSNHEATFYTSDAVALARDLVQRERFVAQVTPARESPVTAIFTLAGLSEAIKPLQQACGWQ